MARAAQKLQGVQCRSEKEAGVTIYTDIDQRSDDWRRLRAGRATGSRAADVLGFLKTGKESASRRDYRTQLALERIFGRPLENGFTNADIERGIALERAAIAAYEAHMGDIVTAVGFCAHDELNAGFSPDGFIGADGFVEVKAPRPATHLRWLMGGAIPTDHRPQLVHGLWLTGRSWADFISYCPEFEDLALFIVRLHVDAKEVAAYDAAIRAFLAEVDDEVRAIQALRKVA